MKQADLARSAGISASYLNLIEHNRRRIGGALLGRIARALDIEVAALTEGAGAQTLQQLGEAAAGCPEIGVDLDRVEEFAGRFPDWAALVTTQSQRLRALQGRVDQLVDRLGHDPDLQAALHELLSRIAAIRSTAAILTETDELEEAWRRRFQRNLAEDSAKLADGAAALSALLTREAAAEARSLTPQEELEAFLDATAFYLPALEGPVPELIAARVAAAPELASREARALATAYLTRYRAEASALPADAVQAAAMETGWDPLRLAARFDVSVLAVLRRLAGLPLPVAGPTSAFVTCDGSGTITLRKRSDLLPLPRFGPVCPLWPLYEALARPNQPLQVAIVHVSEPDRVCRAYAMAERRWPDGFDGQAVTEAAMLVLPPALTAPAASEPVQAIGSTCRVCARANCAARREASMLGARFDSPDAPAP